MALGCGRGEGFTHALTMDSDGQHPADFIPAFMAASSRRRHDPGCAGIRCQRARLRVKDGISNGWANLETLWTGIGDSLFGFRVYPIDPLRQVMRGQRWMRHFDFDPEAVVRLCWRGVSPQSARAGEYCAPTRAASRTSTTCATILC